MVDKQFMTMENLLKYFGFLLVLIISFARSQRISLPISNEYGDKKAIIWKGSTFLVTGGCKPPKCDPELKECQRIQTAFRNLYSYCMQSAHGKFPACLRSKFDSNTSLNVPIYASVCDALCHESEPEKLQGLTVCDSPAEEDESLSGHFGA